MTMRWWIEHVWYQMHLLSFSLGYHDHTAGESLIVAVYFRNQPMACNYPMATIAGRPEKLRHVLPVEAFPGTVKIFLETWWTINIKIDDAVGWHVYRQF